MDLIVIVDPSGQRGQDGFGVWEDEGRGIVTFRVLTKASDMPLALGL